MRSTRNTRMFQATTLAVMLAAALPAGAQSTAFSYQGQLDVTGTPAASYDFQADVFATACTTAPCTGTALNPAPMLFPGVTLVQGRFLLSVDPGATVFTGADRYLQLRVRRTGSPSFTLLLPRQKIAATPYAQHAEDAGFAATVAPASVGAAQLVEGAVNTASLGNGAVTAAKIDATQVQRRITGSCPAGSAMRAVDQAGTTPTCEPISGGSGSWFTSGNEVTSGQFIGSTNIQPLELRVFNQRVAQWNRTTNGVNVLLGYHSNLIDAGVDSGVIGGGGDVFGGNRVTGSYGTVSGGADNSAGFASTVSGGIENAAYGGSDGSATIVGGRGNTALGGFSSVSGGEFNCAGSLASWAGGSRAKVRPPSGTSSDPVGNGCDGVENTATSGGDAGTFVWADRQGTAFVSNGPNRFLMRVQDGMTVQATGTQARSRGYFNVLRGDSGLPLANIGSTAVAVFENADGADLHIIAGGTGNKGLRFGDATDAFTGGIIYTPTHNMQFRANGNSTRMTLNANGNLTLTGILTVPALGSAGSTALCRNASNQLATCSSSARYKQAITALGLGLDAVLRLRPVGYEWKDSGMPDVGFVAEEVAQIDERLITRNEKGQVEGVRYERLTAVLAGAVQELAARESLARESNDALRADVEALRAELAQLRALLVRKEH